ncbi:class E sortase [Nocardiopsis sp. RSe5-2]|uniref:Class E sortase n=1 Tax=Nocardiopsis endophytica TaxID=3018445 RepID=A0ABT4U0D5_9ACTN|nr:class E sortase [Nocardiopsis endophytica]MDA2810413.1 class E sortase [Nocardiopsis endophytica]
MVSTTERGTHRRGERGQRGRRRRRRPVTAGDVARGILRGFGELLFTAGIVMLFFAAYQVYGKALETRQEQESLGDDLQQAWEEPKGPDSEPLPGSADSRMYIPALDLQWVVVSGVQPDDIRYSPGHYTDDDVAGGDAADAGEKGNYAVAGHRVSGIFWDIDQLSDGDPIVLEDAENFYTYEVVDERTVTPDQVEVVDPDPFDPENNDDPQRALLTLTTCAPKLNNTHRLIVTAELTDTRPKDQGMPESIADMAPENQADEGE